MTGLASPQISHFSRRYSLSYVQFRHAHISAMPMTATEGDSEESSGSKLLFRVRDSCLLIRRGLLELPPPLSPPCMMLETLPNERGEDEKSDSLLSLLLLNCDAPRLNPTTPDDLLLFRRPRDEERFGGDKLPKLGVFRRPVSLGEGCPVGRKRCRTPLIRRRVWSLSLARSISHVLSGFRLA